MPAGPLIARLVNWASPAAFVVAVVAPPRAPPPDAIVAVISTPAWATLLPDPSLSWIEGCCESGAPLFAELVGWVTMASDAATPEPRVTGPETRGLIPGAPKLSV